MQFKIELLEDFTKWFGSIQDKKLKAVILLNLSLIESGKLKSCKEIGLGGLNIFEYEIKDECWFYFSKQKQNIFIIDGCLNSDREETVERILEEYNGY